jgi:hypothetical protein
MKKLIKKIFGIDKIEAQKAQAEAEARVAEKLAEQRIQELAQAEEAAELAKLTPKERATRKKEPWVAVLETHVNRDNPANGFFELDWNEYFVVQLREAGFGFEGDPDEMVVDLWFKTLARNMLSEEGLETNRSQGFINVQKLDANRSVIE